MARVRLRKFANAQLQQVYDHYIKTRPNARAEMCKGSMGNGYCVGYEHPDNPRPFGQRGSLVYAAWAAGRDVARLEAIGG